MEENLWIKPVACVDCIHFEVKVIFGYCKLGKFFPLSVVSSLPFAFIKRCPDFKPKHTWSPDNFPDLVERVISFQRSYRKLLRRRKRRKKNGEQNKS